MLHRYLPMTEEDKKKCYKRSAFKRSMNYSLIFQRVFVLKGFKIKEAKSEPELLKELSQMASKNANLKEYASFLGAGVYASLCSSNCRSCYFSLRILYSLHTIPTGNFTRELQAIFEFQTMICELTGMDVANSSMYDGDSFS